MRFNGVLSKVTVEPLYNDHLGDRRKWPLYSRVVAVVAVLAAEQKKEGDLVTTSLGFEFRLQFSCGSPSSELSDFRQTTRSANERQPKQTLKRSESLREG